MSNQQAINILKGLEQSLDDYCELNDEGKAAFRMAVTALELFGNSEQLPSTQPEIIRCKDCKQWYMDADSGSACKYTNMYQPADGFCNWAERREDGNG